MSEEETMLRLLTRITLSLLATACLSVPGLVLAQEPAQPLAERWVIVPKAGEEQELSKALRDHIAFRSEHGDPRQWTAFSPLLGDDLDRIAVRSCCHSWADQDTYREWGLNHPEIGSHFDETVAPHVEKYAHFFEEIDWTNSHWNSEGGPYTYFAVTTFTVKPGQTGEFRAPLEKMSQIAIDQRWADGNRSWLWSSNIGGSPTVSIIVPHKNFAGMGGEGGEQFADFLARQLGSADAATDLMKQFSGATLKSDFQIWMRED